MSKSVAKKEKDYNYKAVNLPQDILDEVDDVIKEDKFYRSRADFVKSAIKDKLINWSVDMPDTVLIRESGKNKPLKSISKSDYYKLTEVDKPNISLEIIHFPELIQRIVQDLEKIDRLEKKIDDLIKEKKDKNIEKQLEKLRIELERK